MTRSRTTYWLLILLAAWISLPCIANAQLSSRLSTRFLARGEQALLEVAISGGQPADFPRMPAVENVTIQPVGTGVQTRLLPGRRLEYIFEFLVSSYEVGDHTIPSIEMQIGGTKFRTHPIEFSVFNPDELQWAEARAGEIRFRYASTFRTLNPNPFEGETIPVEIKLFLPADLFVDDWGIPDFERDGLTAWRFQPSALRGRINLLGIPYVAVAYPSTLTPTRSGKVSIGPAKLRLITTQVVTDGILRRVAIESHLKIPKLDLEAKPLPAGAPEGFDNAIGDFEISVTTTETEVVEGDPIPLDIFINGSGNLDTIRPPKPVTSEGWKIYDATPEVRGDERRELSGSAVFRQFIRPLEIKAEIPSYRLVFFNPKKKAYESILTEPIALRMSPSTAQPAVSIGPPQALSTPLERMTDILGLLQPTSLTMPSATRFPGWLGHAIGALAALGLILKALWMRIQPRLHRNPERDARITALRQLESSVKSADDIAFLMTAGRFIERWLGNHPNPDVQAVLAERDAVCFRNDKPATGILDSKRRAAILKTLRTSLTACIAAFLLAFTPQPAIAAEPDEPTPAASLADQARDAYDSAKFTEAIALWLKAGRYEDLAADTLYNIGNASYRAGSPGHAALYYRRALARDPGHQESRQNLRFLKRKHGAITIHRPEYQYALARLPLNVWKGTLWTGAWLSILAMLVFPATRAGARIRVAAVAGLVIGPLLAAFGGLGWRYYPNDAEFAPLQHQAVIINDKTVVHADASRTSPEVIDAPPGSLCEIIKESGRWAYIAFATKTRGWVPISDIEKVLPDHPPTPPKIRKPKAEDKNA